MKTLFITFVLCTFSLTGTKIIGKYQIESKLSYDTLQLKRNGTYKYQSRGDSCWTWTDIKGMWELKSDTLILYHNYSYVENATEFIEKIDEVSKQLVTIDVKDNFGKSISEFEVIYLCTNGKIQTKKTDENGIVVFDKYTPVDEDVEFVGIEIKYKINGSDASNIRYVDNLSDQISISINSQPKTIEKNEEYNFLVSYGALRSIEFPYVEKMSTYKKL
jgi:hypothetical protein